MRNTMYWVEIPAKNFERAKSFYEAIFDIEMGLVPMSRGKYGIFPMEMEAKLACRASSGRLILIASKCCFHYRQSRSRSLPFVHLSLLLIPNR